MPKNVKLPWIKVGYKYFSKEGPKGLKVEPIARKVGKSKSSFYHLFADLEAFTEVLLAYHLLQAKEITDKIQACEQMMPDMIPVLLEATEDLLFNRQLRIHRDNPDFKTCFEETNKLLATSISPIWIAALGLEGQSYLADLVLNLTIENFYLSITEETLTAEWLVAYLDNIRLMVREMIKNKA
ncbi:MAG: TetR/AcrR family transcriptional regulator [Aureispira sp.]|nr:TetR/AcrR family transcriptional regulator [Aureispira sp.]